MIQPLGDDWVQVTHEISFVHGLGIDKELCVVTRFDGNGNARVWFVVNNHGTKTTYDKYDAAIGAYNLLK